MAFLSFSPSNFIHPDLRPFVAKMSFFHSILFYIVHMVDKMGLWHRLPVFPGLVYIGIRRLLHQRYNLVPVGGKSDHVGTQGSLFGRNMPPTSLQYKLLDPHPSVVATKLLARKKLIDNGKQFNMIAASWIQFMIHDWVDHMEDTQQVEIRAPDSIASGCPLKSFKFNKSKEVMTNSSDVKTGFLNMRTSWWDGSVIYGSNNKVEGRVRTFKDGKLKISEDGLLQHDDQGIPISGDVRNSWAGFSVLQALFVKEHNAVCDMLKVHYSDSDDERLYRHAKLVTSAVIAKIHTIDWTVELLKTDTLLAGMRINWYGLLGKRIKDRVGPIFGHILSGFVGMKRPRDHGVPYSLTEEFVSVYRMHPLLPDQLKLRDINSVPLASLEKSPPVTEEVPMEELIGLKGQMRLSKIGIEQMIVSMGHQTSGAMTLWNYPSWTRNLVPQDMNGVDKPDPVDMAALEIYRDRERKVARYNEFRRNLFMIPISKWEDLTDDKEAIETLHEVYGDDVEKLDLLVGLLVEKKIKGFAISETAFFIFLLMAARRLEADRYFTTNFNSESYTEKGLEWVNTTESLNDVLNRHFPDLTRKWMRGSSSNSAFSVWDSMPAPKNYVPLYFRK